MITREEIEKILYQELCRQHYHADLKALKVPGTTDSLPSQEVPRSLTVAGELRFDELVQNVHAGVVQAATEMAHYRH